MSKRKLFKRSSSKDVSKKSSGSIDSPGRTAEAISKISRQGLKLSEALSRPGISSLAKRLANDHGVELVSSKVSKGSAGLRVSSAVDASDVQRLLQVNSIVADPGDWLFGGYSVRQVVYDQMAHIASHSFVKSSPAEGGTLSRLMHSVLLSSADLPVPSSMGETPEVAQKLLALSLLSRHLNGEDEDEAMREEAQRELLSGNAVLLSHSAMEEGRPFSVTLSGEAEEGVKRGRKRTKKGSKDGPNAGVGYVLSAHGAAAAILPRCEYIMMEGKAVRITDDVREALEGQAEASSTDFVSFVAEKRFSGSLASGAASDQLSCLRTCAEFNLSAVLQSAEAGTEEGRAGLVSRSSLDLRESVVSISSEAIREAWPKLWKSQPEDEMSALTSGWVLLGSISTVASIRHSTLPHISLLQSPMPNSLEQEMTVHLVSSLSLKHVAGILNQLSNFHTFQARTTPRSMSEKKDKEGEDLASLEMTIVTGAMLSSMSQGEVERLLTRCCHKVHFSEMHLPEMKEKVIRALQGLGRTVAFLASDVKDALPLMASDVPLARAEGPLADEAVVILHNPTFGAFMDALEAVRAAAPSAMQKKKRLADLMRYLVLQDDDLPEQARDSQDAQMRYLEQLAEGKVATKRCKLLIVGRQGVGKTSLVKKFVGQDIWSVDSEDTRSKQYAVDGEKAKRKTVTDGISMHVWNIMPNVSLNIFDFAGQELFYTTHQFYLDQRALYVLVFDLMAPVHQNHMLQWLNSIQSRAPGAQVLLVGTHADRIRGSKEKRREFLLNRSDSIIMLWNQWQLGFPKCEDMITRIPCKEWSFFPVGKHHGVADVVSGVADYCERKVDSVHVPRSFINLLRTVRAKCGSRDCPVVSWSQFRNWAFEVGIEEEETLRDCTKLLHDLTELMHFPNDWRLSSFVFLDPRFLARVFRSIVSFRHVQRDGSSTIRKSELIERWTADRYPRQLHEPLLHILENHFEVIVRTGGAGKDLLSSGEYNEFLAQEDAEGQGDLPEVGAEDWDYLIPCLLPGDRPENDVWAGFVPHVETLFTAKVRKSSSNPRVVRAKSAVRKTNARSERMRKTAALTSNSLGSLEISQVQGTRGRSSSMSEKEPKLALSGNLVRQMSPTSHAEQQGSSAGVRKCFREYYLPFLPHGLHSRFLVRLFIRHQQLNWIVTDYWKTGVCLQQLSSDPDSPERDAHAMVCTSELSDRPIQVVTIVCKGPNNHLLLGELHSIFQQLLCDWYPGVTNSRTFKVMVGAVTDSGAVVYQERDECLQACLFDADQHLAFQEESAFMFKLLPEVLLPICSLSRPSGQEGTAVTSNTRDKFEQEVKFVRFIGEGGFGSVYVAEWFGQEVAVKKAKIDSSNLQMIDDFMREVSMLIKLQHPCIVRILYYYVQPPCLVMELCQRGDLETALADDSPLVWKQALKIALDIASAVEFMHQHDPPVVHCDLRTPNILVQNLTACAGEVAVKVADVGNSRLADARGLAGEGFSIQTDLHSFGNILHDVIEKVERCPLRGHSDEELRNSLVRSSSSSALPGASASLPPTEDPEGLLTTPKVDEDSRALRRSRNAAKRAGETLHAILEDIRSDQLKEFSTVRARLQGAMKNLITQEKASSRFGQPEAEEPRGTAVLKAGAMIRTNVLALLEKAAAANSMEDVLSLLRAFQTDMTQRGRKPTQVMTSQISRHTLPVMERAILAGRIDFLWETLNIGLVNVNQDLVSGQSSTRLLSASSRKGKTLLHAAVRVGNLEALRLLIEWGADVSLRPGGGMTAIHVAAKRGADSCLRFLLQHVRALHGFMSPAMLAIINGECKAEPVRQSQAAGGRARSSSAGNNREIVRRLSSASRGLPVHLEHGPTARRSSDEDRQPRKPLVAAGQTSRLVHPSSRRSSLASADHNSRAMEGGFIVGQMPGISLPSIVVTCDSPLLMAAQSGAGDCVLALLENGASWPLDDDVIIERSGGRISAYRMQKVLSQSGAPGDPPPVSPLVVDETLTECVDMICAKAADVLRACCCLKVSPTRKAMALARFLDSCPFCVFEHIQRTVQEQLTRVSRMGGQSNSNCGSLLASMSAFRLSLRAAAGSGPASGVLEVENSGERTMCIVVIQNALGCNVGQPVVSVTPLLSKVEPGKKKKVYVCQATQSLAVDTTVLLEVQPVVSPACPLPRTSAIHRILFFARVHLQ